MTALQLFLYSGFMVITNAYTHAQDNAPNVFCNNVNQTWVNAKQTCTSLGGQFLPFDLGTGANYTGIHLSETTDVWTGDFGIKPNPERNDDHIELCSFHYWSGGLQRHPDFYADCLSKKNYICWDKSTGKFQVHTNSFHDIICLNESFTNEFLNKHMKELIPGYYWKNKLLKAVVGDTIKNPNENSPMLCGAYTKGAGHYFDDCSKKRLSLCYLNNYTQGYRLIFNKSCFDYGIATTAKTTTRLVDTTYLANVTTTPPETITEFRSEETTTGTLKETSEKDDNVHQTNQEGTGNGSSQNKEEKFSSETGLIVGLTVGICIAVIFAVILTVYVTRRHRFCFSREKKPDEPTQVATLNYESLSTQRNVSQRDVVYLNIAYDDDNKRNMNQSSTNKIKMNPKKPRVSDGFDCGKYVNNRKHKSMALHGDDYDVTDSCRTDNQNCSEIEYNALDMEDYNRLGDTRQAGRSEHVYNTTVEPEYDVRTQSTHNVINTDSIYNHLDQNETYVGIDLAEGKNRIPRNTHDQTYDRIN